MQAWLLTNASAAGSQTSGHRMKKKKNFGEHMISSGLTVAAVLNICLQPHLLHSRWQDTTRLF